MKNTLFIVVLISAMLGCASQTWAQSFNEDVVFNIDSGRARTDTIDTKGKKIAAVVFPDSLDGTKFAVYTAAAADSTFYCIQYDGADVNLTFADNKQCGFKPTEINQLMRYVVFEAQKATSDTAHQTQARWFKLIYTNF